MPESRRAAGHASWRGSRIAKGEGGTLEGPVGQTMLKTLAVDGMSDSQLVKRSPGYIAEQLRESEEKQQECW